MNKLIELKNIWAGYNGKMILENINLDVFENDFLGIIGPNGGGKSTLLRNMIGKHKTSNASVLIKGNYITINNIGEVKAFLSCINVSKEWIDSLNVENVNKMLMEDIRNHFEHLMK